MMTDSQATTASLCTILVAGATPNETRLIADHLVWEGFQVLAANNGLEVLERACMSQPQLILLDAEAACVSALATCRSLKSDERTRDIPVVLMMPASNHRDLADGFRAGAADHVRKPVHVEALMASVRTHIALRSAHQRIAIQQRRLQACETRFRAIVESGPVAMGITSMPDGHLLYSNARFRELFRVDEAACATVNIVDFYVDPKDRDRLVRCLAAQGSFGDAEVRLRRPDGTQFWAMATARLSNYDGAPAIYVGLHDISGRKCVEDELVRAREQQRALSAYLEGMREDERKRSAREIQDELGQLLTALKMDVSLLRMRLTDDPEAIGRADDMRELVEGTIWMVRNVASHLRPAALNFGLVSALEWLTGQWSRHNAIPCELHTSSGEPALPDTQATALFRIVEAALTNVARHAAAQRVEVTLIAGRGSLDLRVRDDGRGFDVAAAYAKYAYGLLGMTERARLIGGTLRIDSQPCKDPTIGIASGTTISIHVPLENNHDQDTYRR
ncbi:histidine kinase [Paraburkholderia sp. J11-2]|uniref:histidine kinase n=1 Tax=Paraburkholderia sp. J11-2 TaxID=2805431 RepID=UPI002AB718D2|nr:histidine kinase [Paraburkholderia sp. J11-2]